MQLAVADSEIKVSRLTCIFPDLCAIIFWSLWYPRHVFGYLLPSGVANRVLLLSSPSKQPHVTSGWLTPPLKPVSTNNKVRDLSRACWSGRSSPTPCMLFSIWLFGGFSSHDRCLHYPVCGCGLEGGSRGRNGIISSAFEQPPSESRSPNHERSFEFLESSRFWPSGPIESLINHETIPEYFRNVRNGSSLSWKSKRRIWQLFWMWRRKSHNLIFQNFPIIYRYLIQEDGCPTIHYFCSLTILCIHIHVLCIPLPSISHHLPHSALNHYVKRKIHKPDGECHFIHSIVLKQCTNKRDTG